MSTIARQARARSSPDCHRPCRRRAGNRSRECRRRRRGSWKTHWISSSPDSGSCWPSYTRRSALAAWAPPAYRRGGSVPAEAAAAACSETASSGGAAASAGRRRPRRATTCRPRARPNWRGDGRTWWCAVAAAAADYALAWWRLGGACATIFGD